MDVKPYVILALAIVLFVVSVTGLLRARSLSAIILVIPGFVSGAVIALQISYFGWLT